MVCCLSTRNLENTVYCNSNDILSLNKSAIRGNRADTFMSVVLYNMPIIMIRPRGCEAWVHSRTQSGAQ